MISSLHLDRSQPLLPLCTTYSHGHERRPVGRRVVDLHATVVALRRLRRGDVYHVVGGQRGQERGVGGGRRRVAGGARHRDVRVWRRELLQRLMVMQVLLLLLLLMVLLLLLPPRRRVERLRPAADAARAVGRAEYGVDSVAVPEAVDVRE